MRAVLQRVSSAHVKVESKVTGAIGRGLLVLLGVAEDDTRRQADYLVHKISGLRIFPDEQGRMNLSLIDIGGGLLVVSQFTLYADCRKGMRPSFDRAAKPELARNLYTYFVDQARLKIKQVETGVFQTSMSVHLVNEGPVTITCDSIGNME
jgi:D-tyrosyl-tRNA(Tyr) deacylase